MDINTSQTIILDNGSGIIKAGLACERIPKCIIQNSVARPKTGDIRGEIIIGESNDFNKLSIKYPMQHGSIIDWNDMEKVWQHIFHKKLNILSEDHPVLFTEPPLNSRNNREKVAEIFFEKFKVPAMYISMQSILTLYSTGRTTGVVLDCGDGVSSAVPIYQGFAMTNGIKRIDFAGREVTEYLRMLLKKEGINFETTADFEIVKKIKESLCYIGENPIKEENTPKDTSTFKLPDGKDIEIGPSRFRAAEVLFRPQFLGREYDGLHEMLCSSIEESDLDLRSTLFKNIVLSGGSTLFKGFGSRLLAELRNISPKHAQLKIAAPKERMLSFRNKFTRKRGLMLLR
ncbi:actin [Popillia japonica]|uniref:Actin n=1 Tax=Popillia japonica TaxID=7064 RepID=A0AAW1IU55_POPJA